MKEFYEWFDDKSQALFGIVVLCVVFSGRVTNPVAVIVGNVVSGLLGVAIGRALPRTNGTGAGGSGG
jgi:hypothetical protein